MYILLNHRSFEKDSVCIIMRAILNRSYVWIVHSFFDTAYDSGERSAWTSLTTTIRQIIAARGTVTDFCHNCKNFTSIKTRRIASDYRKNQKWNSCSSLD